MNNSPADFSPDGTKLLFVSDSGPRVRVAPQLRPRRPAAKKTVYEQTWDVSGAELLEERQVSRSSCVNEDSKFAARVLDAATLQPVSLPGMPTGLVRGVSFRADDSLIAFYASDGSVPDELYVGQHRRGAARA